MRCGSEAPSKATSALCLSLVGLAVALVVGCAGTAPPAATVAPTLTPPVSASSATSTSVSPHATEAYDDDIRTEKLVRVFVGHASAQMKQVDVLVSEVIGSRTDIFAGAAYSSHYRYLEVYATSSAMTEAATLIQQALSPSQWDLVHMVETPYSFDQLELLTQDIFRALADHPDIRVTNIYPYFIAGGVIVEAVEVLQPTIRSAEGRLTPAPTTDAQLNATLDQLPGLAALLPGVAVEVGEGPGD